MFCLCGFITVLRRLVLDIKIQYSVDYLKGLLGVHLEETLLVCLVVIAFGLGIDELESDGFTIRRFEGVIGKILAGFYVVLVGIRPVQLDFLALIGNGIRTILVAALGYKITVVIVAGEEVRQVVIHIGFNSGDVDASGEGFLLFLQLCDGGSFYCIGKMRSLCIRDLLINGRNIGSRI